jgi:hypothetical protein
MDTFMQSQRWKVNETGAGAEDWFQEYRGYHYKNGVIVKFHDDLMSATRIAFMMRRRAKAVPLGSNVRRRIGSGMAKGLDFDLFA